MGYTTAQILRDADNNPIPQYYDSVEGVFKPLSQAEISALEGIDVAVQNFPASQTVDGTVGVDALPSLPAGINAIGSVDVDNFPTSIEVENTTGGSLDVEVVNGIPEHLWLSTDTAPTLGSADRALGVEVNTTTHEMVVKYWTGTAWEVVA